MVDTRFYASTTKLHLENSLFTPDFQSDHAIRLKITLLIKQNATSVDVRRPVSGVLFQIANSNQNNSVVDFQ